MKQKIEIKVINTESMTGTEEKKALADFLYKHLGQYGDPINDIMKSIEYAVNSVYGGKIITAKDGEDICGAVVLNNTGMSGYIPATILVYIAVACDHRGKGIGKMLMQKAIDETEGSIALHVEEDNPAKLLYEKVGFEKKYAEMRLLR